MDVAVRDTKMLFDQKAYSFEGPQIGAVVLQHTESAIHSLPRGANSPSYLWWGLAFQQQTTCMNPSFGRFVNLHRHGVLTMSP